MIEYSALVVSISRHPKNFSLKSMYVTVHCQSKGVPGIFRRRIRSLAQSTQAALVHVPVPELIR